MQITVTKLITLEHCAAVCSNCCSIIQIVKKGDSIQEKIKTLSGFQNFIAQNRQKQIFTCMLQFATVCCNYCWMTLKLTKNRLNGYRIKSCPCKQSFSHLEPLKEVIPCKDKIFGNFIVISKRRKYQIPDSCLVILNSEHEMPSKFGVSPQYLFYTSQGYKI